MLNDGGWRFVDVGEFGDNLNVRCGVDDAGGGERPNELSVDGMCSDPSNVAKGSESAMSLIKDEVLEVSVEEVGCFLVVLELLPHGSVGCDDNRCVMKTWVSVTFGSVKDKDVIVGVGSIGVRKKLFLELSDEADRWNEYECLVRVVFVGKSMDEDGEDSFAESSRCEDDAGLAF